MIAGVRTFQLIKNMDDRGFYIEVMRDEDGLLRKFGRYSTAVAYPGVIKAFQYRKNLEDLWSFPVGNAQIVLHDLRDNSSTKGQTDVLYIGEKNSILLYIPQGVAHGYRALGKSPAILAHSTVESNPVEQPDECWLPWDDPQIGFDWGKSVI